MEVTHDAGVLQPGEAIRPQMTARTAQELAERLYGLKVKSVKELDSYDDRNYFMVTELSSGNPHIKEVCADGYVLKVLNSKDSEGTHVEAQHQVQALLLKEGFNVPFPVLNIRGQDYSREKIYGDTPEEGSSQSEVTYQVHIVRLFIYRPGILLNNVPSTVPILYEIGQYLGRLDSVTKGYNHPSLEYTRIWDLQNLPKLKDFVFAVTDEGHRELINHVLAAFDENVMPDMDRLPRGLIHGDCHDMNLIMKEKPNPGDKNPEEYCISTIIDFGDMTKSCYVFELGICIAHMMVDSGEVEALEACGHVMAGYLTHMELSDPEWQVLKECVAARCAVLLVMGEYTILNDPGNQYVMISSEKRWKKLKLLWDTPKDELHKIWRSVIKSHYR